MDNNILTKVNAERIDFDLEKSHLLLGGTKNYLMTKIPDDKFSNLIETLELFMKADLEAWYHIDSNCLIHEYKH